MRLIDLTFARGESRTLTMRVEDPRTGTGIDLTGQTLTFTVRDDFGSTGFLFQLTTGSGITHDPDQVANIGKFTMTPTTTNTTQDIGTHPADLFLGDERLSHLDSVVRVTASARYGEGTTSVQAVTGLDTIALAAYNGATTVNAYVDVTSGSDANNGLTAASALATIDKVYELFPSQILPAGELIINLADDGAGGVATYPAVALQLGDKGSIRAKYRYLGPDMVLITPTTGAATSTLDATPAVQVDSTATPSGTGKRTRLDFTTAAPGWTVDDFQGSFARITRGGSLVIPEIPISKNSADGIFVDNEDVVAAVLAGDTVEIVEPGAKIEGPAGGDFNIVSINGDGPALEGVAGNFTDAHTFSRIEITALMAGYVQATMDRCKISGLFTNIRGGVIEYGNCIIMPAQTVIGSLGSLNAVYPSGTFLSATAGRVDSCHFDRIQIIGGTYQFTENISVWDAALPNAIIVRGRAYASFQGVLQGTGNAGFGIAVSEGAYCGIVGGDDTVITGATADLQLTASTVSYGTGVGALEEVAGYAGILTRSQENAGASTSPRGDGSIIYVIGSL